MTLVLIPCIFIFAGCNPAQLDQKVQLDTRGNYTEVTAADAKAAVEDSDINEAIDSDNMSMRMYIDFSVNTADTNMSGYMTYLFKQSSTATTNNMESAMRMKMSGTEDGKQANVTFSIYNIASHDSANPDNDSMKTYMDFTMPDFSDPNKTMTGKYDVSENEIPGVSSMTGFLSEMMLSITTSFLPMDPLTWAAMWDDTDRNFAIATSGKTTKVRITVEEVKEGNEVITPEANIYFIIEDGKFAGIQVDNFTMGEGDESTSVSFAITTFDGEIQKPNFNDYASYELPAGL